MCKDKITGNHVACNCHSETKMLLSRDELIKMLGQYKEQLESALRLVNRKIKSGNKLGKEVKNMSESKKDAEKSETGKAAQEKSGCGCGCVPPVKK